MGGLGDQTTQCDEGSDHKGQELDFRLLVHDLTSYLETYLPLYIIIDAMIRVRDDLAD
jgi:hypothetical protein